MYFKKRQKKENWENYSLCNGLRMLFFDYIKRLKRMYHEQFRDPDFNNFCFVCK